jgi:hypothetical protein
VLINRKWKNVNSEEGRRNYWRLRNELKRATEKARKEYITIIILVNCNWCITRWQWLFYIYTNVNKM